MGPIVSHQWKRMRVKWLKIEARYPAGERHNVARWRANHLDQPSDVVFQTGERQNVGSQTGERRNVGRSLHRRASHLTNWFQTPFRFQYILFDRAKRSSELWSSKVLSTRRYIDSWRCAQVLVLRGSARQSWFPKRKRETHRNGNVVYQLKTPYDDGTNHVVLMRWEISMKVSITDWASNSFMGIISSTKWGARVLNSLLNAGRLLRSP